MRLKDKIAIVTGAASGFGEAIAKTFADNGAKVIIADINDEGAKKVAGDIGENALTIAADVTKKQDVAKMMETAVSNFGGLDIQVNNAGYTHENQCALEVTEDDFDKIYAINVKAIYLSTLACVPLMEKRGGGVIINTASTAGIRPRPGLTWYNGSKGAAVILTKSLALELASRNIRVNAINPVIGETGMLKQFMGGEDTPQNREKFLASIPLGRMSKPTDIANAALFLADPASKFITGIALDVDDGRCV